MATVFLKNKIDLFQFFVTPQPYFSKFYKKFLMTNKRASIQITTSIHTLFDRNRKESISSLFFADHVVVNSDHAKRMLEDAGVKNVIRIYPGVETERFKPLVAKNTCCGRKVVYPGTYKILNDSYSFEDFLDIAVHVTKYVPDVNFVMACRVRTREDALLKKKFISLLKARDISNFTITDTVEDMPALFNDCVAGIMPAKKPMVGILEIPLVILELAALGKPVVYGNVAPLDEISTKGIGILAADNTVGSYAESLKKCICDVAFSSQVGARSRDAVSRDFTMDNVASQYRQLYRSMTENKTA
jgi:glycosyltransferase involved in cell wall biosynthesis